MSTVVLLSGGLDSAVLAAHEARTARIVPVYVGVGLASRHRAS
jgi:7-cyano-7-deazaguanine synthase in queuosine biosynthesis